MPSRRRPRRCGSWRCARPAPTWPAWASEGGSVKYTVIGMISGTSYDAIDAGVADFDLVGDEIRCHPRGLYSRDLPPDLRARIAAALPPHATTLEEVCRLDTEIGRLFGEVAVAANETH